MERLTGLADQLVATGDYCIHSLCLSLSQPEWLQSKPIYLVVSMRGFSISPTMRCIPLVIVVCGVWCVVYFSGWSWTTERSAVYSDTYEGFSISIFMHDGSVGHGTYPDVVSDSKYAQNTRAKYWTARARSPTMRCIPLVIVVCGVSLWSWSILNYWTLSCV